MLTQIKNIIGRIRHGEAWNEKRLEKCAYFIKWKQIQSDIKNAKAYNDRKTIQNYSINLQWLVSINEFAFDERIETIRAGNAYWLRQPNYKWTEGLDTKEIQNTIYLTFMEQDLEPPVTFDIKNKLHRKFAFDISADFEKVVHQTRFDNLPIEENSLSFPKQYIENALSFFSHFCNNKEYNLTIDYVEELKDRLNKFISN